MPVPRDGASALAVIFLSLTLDAPFVQLTIYRGFADAGYLDHLAYGASALVERYRSLQLIGISLSHESSVAYLFIAANSPIGKAS